MASVACRVGEGLARCDSMVWRQGVERRGERALPQMPQGRNTTTNRRWGAMYPQSCVYNIVLVDSACPVLE